MYGFVYITMYGVQCTMYKTTWEWVEINEELDGIYPVAGTWYQILLKIEDTNYYYKKKIGFIVYCIVLYSMVL